MGPRTQGNGAGDKMCTRCGWTPDVCKVIQHVASAEAPLGSFATRPAPPEFLTGFRWGWQNLVPLIAGLPNSLKVIAWTDLDGVTEAVCFLSFHTIIILIT